MRLTIELRNIEVELRYYDDLFYHMIACLTYAAGTHKFKFNEYMLFKWLPTAHMLISADEVLYTNVNEDCSNMLRV